MLDLILGFVTRLLMVMIQATIIEAAEISPPGYRGAFTYSAYLGLACGTWSRGLLADGLSSKASLTWSSAHDVVHTTAAHCFVVQTMALAGEAFGYSKHARHKVDE
jgi:predicted MFS family arabinose efflux permease